MKMNDPTTWDRISSHPACQGHVFDPNWYDGDVDADLRMLRLAANEVLLQHPECECELFVLDDWTMYVSVKMNDATLLEICPAKTDDYEPCYFLDVEGNNEEIRVKSISEVLGVLGERINSS